MTETHAVGDIVLLNKDYDWGNGKYAGHVVRIAEVHDHRAEDDCDQEAHLIYTAEFLDSRDGTVLDRGIPVSGSDIDETYDHYEAQRAAFWNKAVAGITGGQ